MGPPISKIILHKEKHPEIPVNIQQGEFVFPVLTRKGNIDENLSTI